MIVHSHWRRVGVAGRRVRPRCPVPLPATRSPLPMSHSMPSERRLHGGRPLADDDAHRRRRVARRPTTTTSRTRPAPAPAATCAPPAAATATAGSPQRPKAAPAAADRQACPARCSARLGVDERAVRRRSTRGSREAHLACRRTARARLERSGSTGNAARRRGRPADRPPGQPVAAPPAAVGAARRRRRRRCEPPQSCARLSLAVAPRAASRAIAAASCGTRARLTAGPPRSMICCERLRLARW